MRFIRKGGRIIPIREREGGGTDKRHVSQKMLAEAASRKKVKSDKVASGALAGAGAGALAMGTKVSSKPKYKAVKHGIVEISRKAGLSFSKKGGKLGLIAGAAIGALAGVAASTMTTKQKVADKLGKYRKKK